MSDEKKFRTFLEWASEQVAKWPEWKRNVLGGFMNYGKMPPYKIMAGNYASAALMEDDLKRRGYDIVAEEINESHFRVTLYRNGYRATQCNAATHYDALRGVYDRS